MITGLEKVLARRAWWIPDFSVWGEPSLGEHEYLALEKVGAAWAVLYGTAAIGESDQEVSFSQLSDHRGNSLPATIKSPRVFVRPKGSAAVFVVGREADDRFKIAHDPQADGPVSVDLWVVELGD